MNTPTPNFDNLLLQTLTSKLHLRQPQTPPSLSTHSLEDILFNNLNLNLNDSDSDTEQSSPSSKSHLAKEEAKLEKDIIRAILASNTDALKPNSGQAVPFGDHHICVGFHQDQGSEYRVWEWHGHIMLFDAEDGYVPEYIYGNYFQRLTGKEANGDVGNGGEEEEEEEEDEEDEKATNLGLKDLIESGESNGGRILHRNVNAGSTRF